MAVARALILGGLCACANSDSSLPAPPPPRLSVIPDADFIASGPAGGRFQPIQQLYTLHNRGGVDIRWTVASAGEWLRVEGPSQGALRPQGVVAIAVSLVSEAVAALPAGIHEASLRFEIPGQAQSQLERRVRLEVGEALPEPPAPAAAPASADGSATSTLDPEGWTILAPSADTHEVYVSSSAGSDRNDGRSPESPKRTIAAAKSALRDGFPDWLLLKRGDVWEESLGQWKLSGRSPSEPMVVGAFGDAPARPRLHTGTASGLGTNPGGGSPPSVGNLAIVGLHFLANEYTGAEDSVGIALLLPARHVLVEDCRIEGYGVNVLFQGYGGRHEDLKLRRCVVVDAYDNMGIAGHPQGMFVWGVDGLLLEENLFDSNGWKAGVPGAEPDVFSHDVYIDNGSTGVVVRRNIIANASSHGMQLRCGGTVVENLFVHNPIALQLGGGNNPEPQGVVVEVHDNVIIDGGDIDADNWRGWGLTFANIASGRVSGNLIANNVEGRFPFAVQLIGNQAGDTSPSIGVHDLLLHDNVVHDWGGGLRIEGTPAQISGITWERNDLQERRPDLLLVEFVEVPGETSVRWIGNRIHGPQSGDGDWLRFGGGPATEGPPPAALAGLELDATSVAYPEPRRDLPSYCHSLGLEASRASFFTAAREQSRSRWKPEFTAAAVNRYVRGGFGLVEG